MTGSRVSQRMSADEGAMLKTVKALGAAAIGFCQGLPAAYRAFKARVAELDHLRRRA